MGESVGICLRIAAAVMAWPGVERAPNRFGGIEFRLGKRELGHLHGDALVDLPFPHKVRDEPSPKDARGRTGRIARSTSYRPARASQRRRIYLLTYAVAIFSGPHP